ncbi:family 10 glycosylhydrolase [Hydrogenimonas sp.]
MRILLLFFVLLAPSLLRPAESFRNEIFVRTFNNFKSPESVQKFVSMCRKYRIDTIVVAFKQDEDDEIPSGTLFYPSRLAPVARGYEKEDLMACLIGCAKSAGIGVKAWIPQFHDQIAFLKRREWRMVACGKTGCGAYDIQRRVYFVNPLHPGVRAYQLSIVEEIVRNYEIDGVVLDWIRFDGFGMDLSPYTRGVYEDRFGYDPLTIDFARDNPKRAEWNRFRTEAIASYIAEVSETIRRLRPGIELGVSILSPDWIEVAQDPALFARYVDVLYPMSYYDDWGYPPEWIYGEREDAIVPLVQRLGGGRKVVPIFDENWREPIYRSIFEHLEGVGTFGWFAYGRWSEEMLRRVHERTRR